jgi:hypothetical protein
VLLLARHVGQGVAAHHDQVGAVEVDRQRRRAADFAEERAVSQYLEVMLGSSSGEVKRD